MKTRDNAGSGVAESSIPTPVDASIIIVSWNARKHLEACLESIHQVATGLIYEVIVVDNGSADGSPWMVRERFPWVRLIESRENLGFSKANNVGINQAVGRYFCLVNSDVVVLEGCLQALVEFMDQNPRVGLAGPRLLNPDTTLQPSCRRFPRLANHLGRLLSINPTLTDPACFADAPADVEVLAGAFWIARRDAVAQVGVLDERFFIYGEDLDWCHRFRQAGWRITFLPSVRAIHFGGASSSVEPERFSRELQYASLQLWRKHHGLGANWGYLASTFLNHAVRGAACSVAASLLPTPRRGAMRAKRAHHWDALRWMLGGCRRPVNRRPAA